MSLLIAFEQAIASTGVAQQLPDNPITRSITVSAPSTNSADVVLGNAGVTSSTGFHLVAGTTFTLEFPNGNTNSIYAIGTAADVYSVIGS